MRSPKKYNQFRNLISELKALEISPKYRRKTIEQCSGLINGLLGLPEYVESKAIDIQENSSLRGDAAYQKIIRDIVSYSAVFPFETPPRIRGNH